MSTKTEKPKKIIGITPKGKCIFPKLHAPDFGTEQFPDPQGHYKVILRIPEDEAHDLVNKLNGVYDVWIGECDHNFKPTPKVKKLNVNDPPWGVAMDKNRDTGEWEEVEGFVDFKFKSAASFKDKKTGEVRKIKPDYFTALNEKIIKVPEIWGGSTVRIAYEVVPYSAAIGTGVSLRINAVQIIQLNQGSNRDAASYGFEMDDSGFSMDQGSDDSETEEDSFEQEEGEPEDF